MAYGDLIAQKKFDPAAKINTGKGLTVYRNSILATSDGTTELTAGYYSPENLSSAGSLNLINNYDTIQYDASSDSYWCASNTMPSSSGTSSITVPWVLNISTWGSNNMAFEPRLVVTEADRLVTTVLWDDQLISSLSLSLDSGNILVNFASTSRFYKFDTRGNYVGYIDFNNNNEKITGITKSQTYYYIAHYDENVSSLKLNISRVDEQLNLLDSFFYEDSSNSIGNPADIEYDSTHYLSEGAILVKFEDVDSSIYNQNLLIFSTTSERTTCTEAPIINAKDLALEIDSIYSPLANVSATDCDGGMLEIMSSNVIENTVNRSVAGIYAVTYQVASTLNSVVAEKKITVEIIAVSARYRSISDIIVSVALEECAISHILNAEGEKIQKVIAMNASAAEMLKINKSVQDMVKELSNLDMVLHSKLGLFDNCLCEPII